MFMSMFTASEDTVTYRKYYDGAGWLNTNQLDNICIILLSKYGCVNNFKTTRGVQTGCW